MKTLFEYCLELKIKVDGLELIGGTFESDFYFKPLTERELSEELRNLYKNKKLNLISNEYHQKPTKFLELRMYTLVPYNISDIQKGIQHEHSVTNFVVNYVLNENDVNAKEQYINWATNWKTVILLNGGTSNVGTQFDNYFYLGTMEQHVENLTEMNVKFSTFNEPDLNNMLTGISFIIDERIFNKRLYPDFNIDIDYDKDKWIDFIGGEKNFKLREFLKNFKLA